MVGAGENVTDGVTDAVNDGVTVELGDGVGEGERVYVIEGVVKVGEWLGVDVNISVVVGIFAVEANHGLCVRIIRIVITTTTIKAYVLIHFDSCNGADRIASFAADMVDTSSRSTFSDNRLDSTPNDNDSASGLAEIRISEFNSLFNLAISSRFSSNSICKCAGMVNVVYPAACFSKIARVRSALFRASSLLFCMEAFLIIYPELLPGFYHLSWPPHISHKFPALENARFQVL